MNLLPMLRSGPRKGKNIETAEMIHCRIEVVGMNFHTTLVTPPPSPKYPSSSPIILVIIEKQVLGIAFTICFPLFFILSHKLFGS